MAREAFNHLTVAPAPKGARILAARLLAGRLRQRVTPITLETAPLGEVGLRIVAHGRRGRTVLWQGERPETLAGVTLTHQGRDRILGCVPGLALLEVEQTSSGPAARALEGPVAGLPRRLFGDGETVFGVIGRGIGTLVEVIVIGAGAFTYGPGIRRAREIDKIALSAVGRLSDGRVALATDNPARGFQLWRQNDSGGWDHLVANGLFRNGCNGVVFDCAVAGGRMALAVGPGAEALSELWNLVVPGEIVVLAPDSACQSLTGASRVSDAHLMRPLAGVDNVASHERGQFTRLVADGDRMYAISHGQTGGARIYRVDGAGKVVLLCEFDTIPGQTIADLMPGFRPGDRFTVLQVNRI